MKIAGRRDPCPAAPSASSALLLRNNPKWPALACFGEPKRFRIGGVHEVEEFHRRASRQIGFHRCYVIAVPGLDPGIDPAIHLHAKKMDPRVKPAGDGQRGWTNFIGIRIKTAILRQCPPLRRGGPDRRRTGSRKARSPPPWSAGRFPSDRKPAPGRRNT